MYRDTVKTREALAKGREKVWTEEMREKLRIANTGKKITQKQRIALNKGRAKGYWKGKRRTDMEGGNNPSWKGGRIKLKERIRNTGKYKKWRSGVFERDDYKCVLCGNTGRLNADHYPLSMMKIMDDFKIETMEDIYNCDILWSLDNGRTLCVRCHRNTPTYLNRWQNRRIG